MNVTELVNKSEVLDIWNNYWITDMTTLDAEDQLRELATVELKSTPQLNENQQTLLDDLKHVYSWQHSHAWDLFYYLVDKDTQMFEEDTISFFYNMSEEESLQVQILFSQWVLEQEETE